MDDCPRETGSRERALATDPEGRAECCSQIPASRDLAAFDDMLWMVWWQVEIYPVKEIRRVELNEGVETVETSRKVVQSRFRKLRQARERGISDPSELRRHNGNGVS